MAGSDVPLAHMLGCARTFDLVFFRGSDVISKGIQRMQMCAARGVGCCRGGGDGGGDGDGEGGARERPAPRVVYSHVGMVIEGRHVPAELLGGFSPNELVVLESVKGGPTNDGVPNIAGQSFFGVQLRSLRALALARTRTGGRNGTMAWAPLTVWANDGHVACLRKLLLEEVGRRYEFSCVHLIASLLKCCRPCRRAQRRHCCPSGARDWRFCSELVAHVLKEVGLLCTPVNPHDVVPMDFVPRACLADARGGSWTTWDVDQRVPRLCRMPRRVVANARERPSPVLNVARTRWRRETLV